MLSVRMSRPLFSSSSVMVSGHQALHHLTLGTAGLDDQAFLEAQAGDLVGQLATATLETAHHAPTLKLELGGAVLIGNGLEAFAQDLTLSLHLSGEAVILPVGFDGLGRGNEGHVIAAEGAVVLARRPLVQLAVEQQDGERQTVAAEGLGLGNHVRTDAGRLEAEESAGTATAGLDVVQDQQDVMLAAQFFQVLQPAHAGGIQTALALHRLDDHGGRQVDTAGLVLQQLVHHLDGIHFVAEVAAEGHAVDAPRGTPAPPRWCWLPVAATAPRVTPWKPLVKEMMLVRPLTLRASFMAASTALVPVGPVNCILIVAQAARLKDSVLKVSRKSCLGPGIHIQAMGDAVGLDIFEQRLS